MAVPTCGWGGGVCVCVVVVVGVCGGGARAGGGGAGGRYSTCNRRCCWFCWRGGCQVTCGARRQLGIRSAMPVELAGS